MDIEQLNEAKKSLDSQDVNYIDKLRAKAKSMGVKYTHNMLEERLLKEIDDIELININA